MKPRTILGLVLAAALGVAGYAPARDLVERTAGPTSGAMTGGGMMSGGMAGMMEGCRDMMQGGGMGTRRPNELWRDPRQKTPPAGAGAR